MHLWAPQLLSGQTGFNFPERLLTKILPGLQKWLAWSRLWSLTCLITLFFSYFVGMCGDGANDCGVSETFLQYILKIRNTVPVEYSKLSTCWKWECAMYSQSSCIITSSDLDLIPLCGPYHATAVLGRDFCSLWSQRLVHFPFKNHQKILLREASREPRLAA